MSQVIAEHDALASKREQTKAQEKRINVEASFKNKKLNGDFGQTLIKRAVGIASLPIALFWTLIAAAGTIIMGIVAWIFKFLGKIFTRNK